jgi:hypothetical protein
MAGQRVRVCKWLDEARTTGVGINIATLCFGTFKVPHGLKIKFERSVDKGSRDDSMVSKPECVDFSEIQFELQSEVSGNRALVKSVRPCRLCCERMGLLSIRQS